MAGNMAAMKSLIDMNLAVLDRLYDSEETSTFNYRIYGRTRSTAMCSCFTRYGIRIFNLFPITPKKYKSYEVQIDTRKDLKYIGHVCIGLSWYVFTYGYRRKMLNKREFSLLRMVKNSLDYLSSYQTNAGYLRCRYIREDGRECGNDELSITEATNSFFWAYATGYSLVDSEEKRRILEKLNMALHWLLSNTSYLNPQEESRLIYGLAQLYGTQNDVYYLDLMKLLGRDLVSKLRTSRSFGLFPNDIDTIGALSTLFLLSKESLFYDCARKLVYNQVYNQGSGGQWRWAFRRTTGQWKPLNDTAYTVHQIGMAPFALSLYLAASNYDQSVFRALVKGISWAVAKEAVLTDFVIRSFTGHGTRIYEFEQRSYEPGLNILGLLSYILLNEINARGIDPSYIIFPWKLIKDYDLHPNQISKNLTIDDRARSASQ
jgi:hypothetical protein